MTTFTAEAESGLGATEGLPLLMILEGGPLDGSYQVVENLNTAVGTLVRFNVPNYQTFDPDQEAEVVLSQGLQAIYALVRQGPLPDAVGNNPLWGDNWAFSWIFGFTGEAYVPPPSTPLEPPPTQVWTWVIMGATTTLVPDTMPILTYPVVTTMTAESGMYIVATVQPYAYGVVAMTGESVMTVEPDWWPQVNMTGTAGLTGDSGVPGLPQDILYDQAPTPTQPGPFGDYDSPTGTLDQG